jgi:hypothetical protein
MALKKLSRKKTVGFLLVIVLILLTVVLGIFLYMRYQDEISGSVDSAKTSNLKENEELIRKIGKLIMLPNSTPDVATVTDVAQLGDQSIFRNAKNGDKVLIYKDVKRAIVYRPSENIIVEVGNIIIEEASPTASLTSEETVSEATIAVYNATSTPGYASRIGDQLESKFLNIQIADTANAVNDYQGTLVINLTGENDDLVKILASELGGEEAELPEGEDEPDTDILIILGE